MPKSIIIRRIFVRAMLLSLLKRMSIVRFSSSINRFIFACVAGVVILPAMSAVAQTSNTLSCGGRGTIDLGAVLSGGTIQDSLYLMNSDNKGDSVFRIISAKTQEFSWTISSGIRLAPGDSGYVTTFIFSDSSLRTDSLPVVFEPNTADSDSCQTTFEVLAEVVGSTGNNSILPLKHTSHNIIAFKSDTSNETLQIQFQNNFGKSLPIQSLGLQNDTAFHIVSSSISFPDTLPSGGSFTLNLSFTAKRPGFYTDFITSPDQPILPLSVQGLLLPNDAVQIQPANSTYLSIYPNPSYGSVTIHTENITHADLTITDVLGRTVKATPITGDWLWDRSGANGTALAGTYFIVVTGTGSNDEAVHEVQRVVLE